nr:ribosome small subunit-dependent GTPase A [candidate division Zixibacteria bacterium]
MFIVRTQGQDIPCEIRGKIKHQTEAATPVAVGDNVVISLSPDGTGMIEEIGRRRSMFFRPSKGSESKKQIIAANIDQLAIVAAIRKPDLKPGLIDRFLIAARIGNLEPVIIINKIDLGGDPFPEEMRIAYFRLGIPIFLISALTGKGMDSLENILKDKKTIFAGHSGVGKSTILNHLMPGLNLRVCEVSDYSNRGVHTTSLVELFELPRGGFVVDSPGLKVLGLWEVAREQLDQYYPEFIELAGQCRFVGCSHTHEPGCAVKKAVDEGLIPAFRYRSYQTIYDSL